MSEHQSSTESPGNDPDQPLHRENLWVTAPEMLKMWEAWNAHVMTRGRLVEMVIQHPNSEPSVALQVRVGIQPSIDGDGSGSTATAGGFLHFLPPFQAQADMSATSILYRFTPWLVPGFIGLLGYSNQEPDRPIHVITYEQPLQLWSNSLQSNAEIEQLHFDRFCTDWTAAVGQSPYAATERGSDPPDFLCSSFDGIVGVECAQFADNKRRTAHGIFKRVRKRIVAFARSDRTALSHLFGLSVYLRYSGMDLDGTFRAGATEESVVDRIVEMLVSFRPDIAATFVAGGELPQQAPPLTVDSTVDGWSVHAAPFVNAFPLTQFAVATGFELGIGVQTSYTKVSARAAIASLVDEKDIEANKHLIITVGGPDSEGYVFPAEEVAVDAAQPRRALESEPRYLKRIFIHYWMDGRIVQFYPQAENPVLRPNFGRGLIPAHMQFTSDPSWVYTESVPVGDELEPTSSPPTK